jgi:non-ribosomal peptide synthetase component F
LAAFREVPIMSPGRRFIELRDQLLRLREDYAAALREFRWPQFEHFNWAHDYFDAIAAGNHAAALRVVDDAGGDQTLSFAELAQRSDQVANFLAAQGLRAGERLLLMLPNSVPLWETMLAAIKLGAVMIPATTLLEREDLRDRLERGQVKAIVTAASLAGRFAGLAGAPLRIAVGGAPSGWTDYECSRSAAAEFSAAPTRAADLLLLYFTSGTSAPEAGGALARQLSRRAPVDHVLARHPARRCTSESELTGLGQARLVVLLCSVECPGDHTHLSLRALRCARAAGSAGALPRDHVLRTAHGVAHVDPA